MPTKELIIINDGPFDIATGKSRKETHWRNRETTWSAFVGKISETHRTAETLSEYMGFKKTLQDERKDIGGFVGGYVNNGRRKAENITHRQLITLDIDFATGQGQTWDDFTMLYDNAAAVYSTHKHMPESPRLRLILPLDRPVSTDEYIAIARRIAGDLDINTFDDTTYEPSRLMYWPSTSKDGEYVFQYQDGPWLDADKVLSSYKNWQDASEWPVSDRAGEVLQREIKKQGDPLEKPGVVGAFCREYDIHEAIETFLGEQYDPCDIEDRYTFIGGSTAAGLVVYDDKYAFSHHGTDPASGKLCNAFDLVRLHLYGLKDEDAREGTPSNKLPSFMAMVDCATKDGKVRKRLGTERRQEAKDDFEGYAEPEETEEENTDWEEKLEIDKRGDPLKTNNNAFLIIDNHPAFKGLAFNEFSNNKEVKKSVPWREKNDFGDWLDSDTDNALKFIEKGYGIANEGIIKRALRIVFSKRKYHPVRDYLNSVEWDNEQRIETLIIEYLGAEDTPYVRAVTRICLVAAVARIFQPGIPYDQALILVGGQGLGKSTLLRKLGKFWFSDNFAIRGNNQDVEQLMGVWLVEMSELAGLRKSGVAEIKNYISKVKDEARLAYATEKQSFPRQCVFFGTTNENTFLSDVTGNRRFWPVKVGVNPKTKNIWEDLDGYEIDQIWAEAVSYYKAGESLVLAKELISEAIAEQEDHAFMDDRTGIVLNYLETLLPENWADLNPWERRNYLSGDDLSPKGTQVRTRVCVAEIWCECFNKDKGLLDRKASMEINEILAKLKEWEPVKNPVEVKPFGRQRVYRRLCSGTQTKKASMQQSIQASIRNN